MSAWNTYFISENCGANIDFLFLKQWFYGILFWNMKEVALWVTNLTLMVNGTMDWVSLCEDIWSQQRKLWAPDESVLYWWISRLIGHEVVSKRDGVNQRVDHQMYYVRAQGSRMVLYQPYLYLHMEHYVHRGLPRFWWFIATLILRCHGKGSEFVHAVIARNYETCWENKQGIQ